MRKISADAARAFYARKKFKRSNTEVVVDNLDRSYLYLHGNLIAVLTSGSFRITDSGWSSVTTKDRLNALDGVSIYQKDWQWYLNDKKWDGDWVQIHSDGSWTKTIQPDRPSTDTYKIIRFYADPDRGPKVMQTGLTRKEAQAWCSRNDTRLEDADGRVIWFDGFDSE